MIFSRYPRIVFAISKISDGNMSLILGNAKKSLKNRQKFFNKLEIDTNYIAEVQQINHGNKVIYFEKARKKLLEADGLITDKPGIFLLIKVADCLPIGIYDPVNTALGLVHAGRKGLEKGIIKNVIQQMRNKFKSKPKELLVEIGPSIGPCHYTRDLWTEAEEELVKNEVSKDNINNLRVCTYHNKDYFSHRRSVDLNLPDYRFVTILGLKNVN